MEVQNEKKILGCLIGAAAGDAMGAATECRSQEQIKSYFGDFIYDFKDPPDDTFAQGNKAAMCTDDFWQAYYILNAILEAKEVTEDSVKNGFKKWLTNPCYENFTGPTTRVAMANLFNDKRQSFQGALEAPSHNKTIINDGNSKGTNGGAMKIFPAGLLHPANVDAAINDAIVITCVTHKNNLSVSGACAIAASVSESFKQDASINSIVEAGLYGAQKGDKVMRDRGCAIAGASVYERMKLACEIGKKHSDWKKGIRELADIIGNGLQASEAVSAVYGIISMCANKPDQAIYAGVNIGNDTDTIATMVGAIMGAYYGSNALPEHFLQSINAANNINLEQTTNAVIEYLR